MDEINEWLSKGVLLSQEKKYHESLKYFEKILTLEPNNISEGQSVMAWDGKGVCLENLGKKDEALECYDKAIALKPIYPPPWLHKGNVLRDLGRYQESLECYNKAIDMYPNDKRMAEGYYLKGELLRFSSNLRSAESKVSFELGYKERRKKYDELVDWEKVEDALRCFEKALELDPEHTYAQYGKGLVLIALGRTQEALSCFEEILKKNPFDKWALGGKGTALKDLGRLLESIVCMTKSLELIAERHPESLSTKKLEYIREVRDVVFLNHLGFKFTEDKLEQVFSKYHDVKKGSQKNSIPTKASTKQKKTPTRHKKPQAKRSKTAKYKEPRKKNDWVNQAVKLKAAGDFKKAIECCERELELDPANNRIWELLGELYVEIGEYLKADQCFKKVKD